MTPTKSLRLSRSCLRALAAILQAADRGQCPTARELIEALGRRSMHLIVWCLNRLRVAGLITWEWGKYRTIRPRCRMLIFRETR